MMGRRGGREALVGMVVAAGLVTIVGTILIIGEQTQLFKPKVEYRTVFPDASGLGVGSPVSMAGVKIGAVESITLPTDPDAQGTELRLSVDKAYELRIREGTTASTSLLQLITNEKYVELTPGDPALPLLPPDAEIPAHVDPELLARGETIADNLDGVTRSLQDILSTIQRGEGLLGQAIMDPDFGQEGLDALKQASLGLEELLGNLNSGRGVLGRLVTDREFGEELTGNLSDALSRISRMLERLEAGEGALGELLRADGAGEESVTGLLEDLAGAVASLRRTVESLEAEDGFYHKVFRDPDYSGRVSANLDETLANLASITRKLDEGEGTLGALINDPSLHRGLEDVVFGARDSKVVRWAVRHYRKNGEKARADGVEQAPEEPAGE